MDNNTLTTLGTGFLRLPQVLALIPVSKSTWWEGCRTGRFPKPIKLTERTTVWRAEDIATLVFKLEIELVAKSKMWRLVNKPTCFAVSFFDYPKNTKPEQISL